MHEPEGVLRRTHNYRNLLSQMKTRGVSHCVTLPFYIKKYLKAKEELRKIQMFQHAKT